MKILITGFAGFIGFHLTNKLYEQGHTLYGIDNLSANLCHQRYDLLRGKITVLTQEFDLLPYDLIIHLAARPGVQLSMTNPELYTDNITMFLRILMFAKENNIKLIYASSSSADNPESFYGLTKQVNEQTAKLLYPDNSIGLRFFTVYGPWGRPDMSYFKFTQKIIDNMEIELWGNYVRDFTYIDDIVDGIIQSIDMEPGVYEIGSNNPQPVQHLIYCLEKCIGKKATVIHKDVYDREMTWAKNSIIKPKVSFEKGIEKFVQWYKEYVIIDLPKSKG